MRILADENIPFVNELFGPLGEVTLRAGRRMTPADAARADALLVRSVTKVNAALLEGAPVKFVATATIGTDHVDQAYLASRGIGFASAPGSNAESVAQYVAAALAFASLRSGRPLSGCSIGVVGAGNCGSRVARVAGALGMRVVLNDPPLARATGEDRYRPLNEALACDFISLHVPLTKSGPDATWGLIGAAELARMPRGATVMNICRGHVLDEAAALVRLREGALGALILDAWENEPRVSSAAAARVLLGTPHIAGYSFDGKAAGARMIYEALCRYFDLDAPAPALAMPAAAVPVITLDAAAREFDSLAAEAILTAYPIQRDDGDLRRALAAAGAFSSSKAVPPASAPGASSPAELAAAGFDALRKNYPLRREFAAATLSVKHAPPEWLERLAVLGFAMAPQAPRA